MSLPELCLRRPVATLTILLASLVLGSVALTRLPLEYLPEIEGRSISIACAYPGSSPRELERTVAAPLEEELASLQGLESLESTCRASGVSLRIELSAEADLEAAALEVRERIDRARASLPPDLGKVELRRWQSGNRPVFRFRVAPAPGTSPAALERLVDQQLTGRLGRLPGVGNVEVRGLARQRVLVEPRREGLAQAGLSASDLARILRLRNRNASAGELRGGGKVLSLRVPGELGSAEAVARIPLGQGLLLADVARVRLETEPLDRIIRLDGQEAITVEVSKESGANSIETCRRIRAELLALAKLPRGQSFKLDIMSDDAEKIMARLENLRQSGLYGGILLCVVLFLFLRDLRSTCIVALTIPLSLVLTFGVVFLLRQLGVSISLNVVSLMGLILGVGLVVDNGIVVLENIVRLREEGLGAFEAAAQGAGEVSQAITASMLTSLIVFVPLLLTDSMSARWMRDLALMVCAAVFSSLWVAQSAVPLLAAHFLPASRPRQGKRWALRAYAWLLGGSLRFRWLILLLILPFCAWQIQHFFGNVERSWGGGESRREVILKVEVPRAATPTERRALFERLEGLLLAQREALDLSRLTTIYRASAEASPAPRGRGWRRSNDDRLELILREEGPGERRSLAEVRSTLRRLLPELPGVVFQLGASRRMGGGGRSVTVNVKGRSADRLSQPAAALAARFQTLEGVEQVEPGLPPGTQELLVEPRHPTRFQVRPLDLGRALADALGERVVTRLRARTREIDVVLRLRPEEDSQLKDLRRLSLSSPGGRRQVGALVSFKKVPAAQEIRRVGRQAVIPLTIGVEEGAELRSVSQRIEAALAEFKLPPGVEAALGSRVRRWREGEGQSAEAALLALVLVVMLLSALFESTLEALLIAVTVPFALVGVAWAFWLSETRLDDIAWIGLMILTGIVVNHGIVFVDRTRRLLSEGRAIQPALLEAGQDRLRPIVMTAATTILGLLPIVAQHLFPQALQSDSGAAMYGPIGLAVASGLLVSTALTLLILPALLSVAFEARARLGRARRTSS